MPESSDTPAFEEKDLISLGQKLAALDLTEPETAALQALLTDDDVAGFGRTYDVIGGIRKGRTGWRHDGQWGVRPPKPAGIRNIAGPKPGDITPGRF